MPLVMANTLATVSIVVILFASSLKARFGLSDAIALYLPFLVLVANILVANALDPKHLLTRLKYALAFLGLFCAPLYAYAYGGLEETAALKRIILNCTLGSCVVMVPWTKQYLKLLYVALVVFGCIVAVNTLLVYEQLGSRSGTEEEIKEGYLSVTFAMAMACIACFYLLVDRITVVSLGAFALCWVGIALSLGRGSLLFCGVVTVVYFLLVSVLKVSSMSNRKSMAMLIALACMTPIVVAQVMSVERTAHRLTVLFTDSTSQAGVAGRLTRYDYAIGKFYESPLTGHGLQAWKGDGLDLDAYSHNIFLQYTVDGGLISLLILVGFLAFVILGLARAVKYSTPAWRNIALVASCQFLFMLLSYSKSHDAYRGREMFMLSGLAIATTLAVKLYNTEVHRKPARRRHSGSRRKSGNSRLRQAAL